MSYQQKMIHHLQRAEALNAEVDNIEADALRALKLREIKTPLQAYEIKHYLELNNLYKQRGNARDLHLRLATAYGIANLGELLNQP